MRLVRFACVALLSLSFSACLKASTPGSEGNTPGIDAGSNPDLDAGQPGLDAGEPDAGPAHLGDGVLLQDDPAGPIPVRSLTVDFGAALVGTQVEKRVKLRNDGDALLEVIGITSVPDPADGFAFATGGFLVDVGQTHEFVFTFEPAVAGAHEAQLTVHLRNAAGEDLAIALAGRGVDRGCQMLPAEGIEFGSVATATTESRTAYVVNSSEFDWDVTVAGIASDLDPNAFSLDASAEGTHHIAAGSSLPLAIAFSPTHLGRHRAQLKLSAPPDCQPAAIDLSGTGIEDALDCDPKAQVIDSTGTVRWECRVDFGFVPPTFKQLRTLTLRNLGSRPITLSSWGIDQGSGPAAIFGIETTGTGAVIAAGGTTTVSLSFTPVAGGAREAQFTFFSDDPKRPRGQVHLIGYGGGPQLQPNPATVDFGVTAVVTSQRTLELRNGGIDVTGTSDDNLLFGERGTNGLWVERAPEIIGSTDFSILWPPAGYSSAGIAAGAAVSIPVAFAPTSAGVKSATLRVYSNDLIHPQLDIPLKADARTLTACSLVVMPAKLDFGSVDVGLSRTLKATVKNNSVGDCLITNVQLSAATASTFTLVNPPTLPLVVRTFEQFELQARFTPTTTTAQVGSIEIAMANPGTPPSPVLLVGTSVQSCLVITPTQYDFGQVQQNCNSREQSFQIFNACTSAVSVTSIGFAGGSSTSFRISYLPVLPMGLAAGGSQEFRVTYKPLTLGLERAIINVQSSATTSPQPVAVSGEGVLVSTRNDTFVVDRKVDVLLIVDDSCSMSTVQAQLANSFNNFMLEATTQQADYRLAVTTTSADQSADANGRFVPISGAGTRIITPSTPNAAGVFAQNVQVGTLGSPFEKLLKPGFLALTPPLVGAENAGFLRADASLRILVVSDAADQDTNPSTFYERFFQSLKDGDKNRFSMSGLLATQATAPANCYYDDYNSGQSTKVRDIIARTGGVTEEICTTDFAGAFTRLGKAVFGLRSRHLLSAPPDLSGGTNAITVQLNGQPFPAVGPAGETRWTYNATLNAIETTPQSGLVNGSVLKVSYPVPCL